MTKTINVSNEVYESIQELKKVFEEMAGKKVEKDEHVIEVLVAGFIDSLNEDMGDENTEEEEEMVINPEAPRKEGNCGSDCGCHH